MYRGQRKLFGKDERCYRTLALLARIHELQENSSRADAYRSIISSNIREQMCGETAEVSISKNPAVSNGGQQVSSGETQWTVKGTVPTFGKVTQNWDVEKPDSPPFQAREISISYGISMARWSPDNSLIALIFSKLSSTEPGCVELRSAMTGRLLHNLTLPLDENNLKLAFDGQGRRLAVTCSKKYDPKHYANTVIGPGFLVLWDVKSGTLLHQILITEILHWPGIGDICFNPGGDQIAVSFTSNSGHYLPSDEDCSVTLFNTRTGSRIDLDDRFQCVRKFLWTKDHIALVCSSGIWLLDSKTKLPVFKLTRSVERPQFSLGAMISPAGTLVTTLEDGSINLVEGGNLELLTERVCPLLGERCVRTCQLAFNQRHMMLAMVITSEGRLYLGAPKLNKWVYLQESKQHRCTVADRICFSTDGEYGLWLDGRSHPAIMHRFHVQTQLNSRENYHIHEPFDLSKYGLGTTHKDGAS